MNLIHSLHRQTWKLIVAVVVGLAMMVGVAPAAMADDDPDTDWRTGELFGTRKTIIFDRFNRTRGQSRDLEGREPDTVSIGSVWHVELGDWLIRGPRRAGYVVERSREPWEVASDKSVNIDAERANLEVSASIRRGRGASGEEQGFGIRARYSGPVNWLGAWFDPNGWDGDLLGGCPRNESWCGAIVLGEKDQPGTPGFIELKRFRYEWGRTETLRLIVRGNDVWVKVGRRTVIHEQFEGLGDATEVGLFSRGPGKARFKDFKVTGRKRFPRLDQIVTELDDIDGLRDRLSDLDEIRGRLPNWVRDLLDGRRNGGRD